MFPIKMLGLCLPQFFERRIQLFGIKFGENFRRKSGLVGGGHITGIFAALGY